LPPTNLSTWRYKTRLIDQTFVMKLDRRCHTFHPDTLDEIKVTKPSPCITKLKSLKGLLCHMKSFSLQKHWVVIKSVFNGKFWRH